MWLSYELNFLTYLFLASFNLLNYFETRKIMMEMAVGWQVQIKASTESTVFVLCDVYDYFAIPPGEFFSFRSLLLWPLSMHWNE